MGVEGWLNLRQVAEELGIKNPAQLRKLIAAEKLEAHKPGGRDWMVSRAEVERYRASRAENGRRRHTPARSPASED